MSDRLGLFGGGLGLSLDNGLSVPVYFFGLELEVLGAGIMFKWDATYVVKALTGLLNKVSSVVTAVEGVLNAFESVKRSVAAVSNGKQCAPPASFRLHVLPTLLGSR